MYRTDRQDISYVNAFRCIKSPGICCSLTRVPTIEQFREFELSCRIKCYDGVVIKWNSRHGGVEWVVDYRCYIIVEDGWNVARCE